MRQASWKQRLSPEEAAEDSVAVENEHSRDRMVQMSRLGTIGEMAAGIANELNQPLTAIVSYAEAYERLVGREAADREEVCSAFHQIAAQAFRAGDILRWLRNLAHSQSMRRQPGDINATIEEIRELILAEARIHRARVAFVLATELPRVSIDAAQIQHVVLNLVRNGFQALTADEPSRRTLSVHTRVAKDGDVEIAICDTGPGLSSEALAKMFEPFSSAKSSRTGLDMSISNMVVRAHGGTLSHRANVPCGACFDIRLPTTVE